jgi:hypothetical protein
MADRVRRAVTDRQPNGDWVHPLNAGAGMVVSGRRISEIGVAEAASGLWQVVDTYVLDVQAL